MLSLREDVGEGQVEIINTLSINYIPPKPSMTCVRERKIFIIKKSLTTRITENIINTRITNSPTFCVPIN